MAAGLETDETDGMKRPPDPHYRHRFPAEIISQAVWLYHVFSLSLRDVQLLLAERGVVASYETIRRWCKKFGQTFAGRLRRISPGQEDEWFLDEVFIRIQGVQHYLWRAVDREGVVLDIPGSATAGAKAAKQFFGRLLKGLQYVPRVIVTDKLRSYGVAQRRLLPKAEHRQSRYLNNRAENSHRPTRRRERQMQRFNRLGSNDFLSRARIHLRSFPSTTTPTGGLGISRAPDRGVQFWQQDTCVRNAE